MHDPPCLLDAVLSREAGGVADHRGVEEHLVRRCALAALAGELHVELDLGGARGIRPVRREDRPDPGGGSSLTTIWLGSGKASPKPSRGGCLKTTRTSVWVTGRRLPVRMKNGTPDQRQFSISSA